MKGRLPMIPAEALASEEMALTLALIFFAVSYHP